MDTSTAERLISSQNPLLVIGLYLLVVVGFVVWSLIWKGTALWKSARSGDKGWFVALLIINTMGILEILYIYVFSKKSGNTGTPAAPTTPTAV